MTGFACRTRARLLLAGLAIAMLFVALPLAASAIPPRTISGMRTLSDGSPDNLTLLQLYYEETPGSWIAPGPPITALPDGSFTATVSASGNYRVGVGEATNGGTTGYPPAFYGGGQTFATATSFAVNGPVTGIDIQRAAGEVLTTDTAEPDNLPAYARDVAPGADPVERTLAARPDADWFQFDAIAGHRYSIETSGSVLYPVWGSLTWSLSDTALYLYGADGATELARNDDRDSSRYSRVVWTAPANMKCYAKVTTYKQGYNGSPTACGAYTFDVEDQGVISGTGGLQGHVYDALSPTVGVAGMLVEAIKSGGGYRRPVMTDGDGFYSFAGLEADNYQIKVTGPGFVATYSPGGMAVTSGATATVDVVANQPASPTLGSVWGCVGLASGGPAEGVTVTVQGSGPPAVIQTDGNGMYTVPDLPLEDYTVVFELKDCRTITEANVHVRAGNGSESGVIFNEVLQQIGGVQGVVRSGGRVLSGVKVQVGRGPSMTTGADGAYRFRGVDAVGTSLYFSRAGYESRSQSAAISQGATLTADVSLTRLKTACTIARTPSATKATYKRSHGTAKYTLKAKLSGIGGVFFSSPIYLQVSKNGHSGWKSAAPKLTTNSLGIASRTLSSKAPMVRYYRWYTPSTAQHLAKYSSTMKVTVK